jgi:uncharacterized cupredoxin-like copper-binding protein
VKAWVTAVVAGMLVGGSVTGLGYAAAADEHDTAPVPLGPGEVTVQIDVEHSRFSPDALAVAPGTRVRFVVVNADPIGHELITGGPEVHARHTTGTEAHHGSIPGEVSVGPNATAMTTFTFGEPGQYEFACHLPGHYEFGMYGTIDVVDQAP